ncbi:hypothetical protein C2W62_11375 [Candidatus Entotheonella serta]|nr:hypothetical protein C2W62_11375 [Candidatus Entotheonella serta]
MDTADIVIAGGGIAGASLAYFLSRRGVSNAILLERESTFGYHSSGRSAAISREWNEDPVMLVLKRISHQFFRNLPEDFSEPDVTIMDDAGVLDVVSPEDVHLVEQTVAQSQADGVATEHWDGIAVKFASGCHCSNPSTWAAVCITLAAAISPFTNCSLPTSNTPVPRACRYARVQKSPASIARGAE